MYLPDSCINRLLLLLLSSSALFAPRMFTARPGQKSPTALHDDGSTDRDKDDGINYTTVDWREFMCNTWHLEPTLRSAPLHRSAGTLSVSCCFVTTLALFTWRGQTESQSSVMNKALKPAEAWTLCVSVTLFDLVAAADFCSDAHTKHADPERGCHASACKTIRSKERNTSCTN